MIILLWAVSFSRTSLRDICYASIIIKVWKACGIVSISQQEKYAYLLWRWWWWFTWACSLSFTWAWGSMCFALYSLPPKLRGHSLTEAAATRRTRDRAAIQWFDPTLKITYSTFLSGQSKWNVSSWKHKGMGEKKCAKDFCLWNVSSSLEYWF